MADAPDSNDGSFNSAFQSISVEIALTNTTTRTSTKQGSQVKLIEIGDQAIALEVPPKTCAKGHNLLFVLRLWRPGATKPFAMTATGKVEEVQALEGADRADIILVQFDEAEWKQVLTAFTSRQDEIEEFLKAARGY